MKNTDFSTDNNDAANSDVVNIEAANEERSTTLAKHWKNGLPSVVLAIVSILIAAYSYWIVNPGIEDRYRSIVLANAKRLSLDLTSDVRGSSVTDESLDLSFDSRVKLLKQSQLCLRRLISMQSSDSQLRWQYALISSSLGETYIQEAKQLVRNGGASELPNTMLGMAKNEEKNATDAMTRIQKLGGNDRNTANTWLVRRQIALSPAPTADQLQTMSSMLGEVDQASQVEAETQRLLASVQISQAFAVDSSAGLEERLELVRKSLGAANTDSDHAISEFARLAKGYLASDLPKAREFALMGARKIWEAKTPTELSFLEQSSAFECLLLSGSLKESQAFLSELISASTELDQNEIRQRANRSCLQILLANSIRNSNGGEGKLDQAWTDSVLAMAIQLSPDSADVIGLFESLSTQAISNSFWSVIRKDLETESVIYSKQLLPILDSLTAGGESKLDEFGENIKLIPGLPVTISRMIVRLEQKGIIELPVAVEHLRKLGRIVPDVIVVWYDRANLHMKGNQFEQAIECLEWLHERVPKNEQIDETLKTARKKLLQETPSSAILEKAEK